MGALAVASLREVAAAEGFSLDVEVTEVSPPLPPPEGYQGSPTILLAGRDLEPAARDRPDTGHG